MKRTSPAVDRAAAPVLRGKRNSGYSEPQPTDLPRTDARDVTKLVRSLRQMSQPIAPARTRKTPSP